jgi:hypothetical protein
MRFHQVGLALALALASCGGAVSGDQSGDDAAGSRDGAAVDATLPEDATGDAGYGGFFPDGWAAGDAVSEGWPDVAAAPAHCGEDAAVDGGCECLYGDAQSWCVESCDSLAENAPCGPVGLYCGIGPCINNCDCTDAGWRCIGGPCPPPQP